MSKVSKADVCLSFPSVWEWASVLAVHIKVKAVTGRLEKVENRTPWLSRVAPVFLGQVN